ncbi:hypothetical protein IAD21_02307 [Abditibacteriota bacterium]|nr:hypothetical protein IAD21_02307 [Abditibacteriota bacterium]
MANSPKSLSSRRDEIFRPLEKPVFFLNDELWPDFYALLEVPRNATEEQLNEAIVEASSQLLAVNFARGMTPRLRLVEQFMGDFRVILLDVKRRARYDALLERHQRNDARAMPYTNFYAGEWGENLVQRAKRRARTVGERLLTTWRDSPYL